MKSSLIHFLITFLIASIVFGLLAYTYYDYLTGFIPGTESSETTESQEESPSDTESETGSNTSVIAISGSIDEEETKIVNGLIICKDLDGLVIGTRFFRMNSKAEMVVSCEFPNSVSLYNDVGALVPLRDYFAMISGEDASKAIRALTGYDADFYIEMTPETIPSVLEYMDPVKFELTKEVSFVNPIYKDYVVEDGGVLPSDYRIKYEPGTITLTTEVYENILLWKDLNAEQGTSVDLSPILNSMYRAILEAIVKDQKTLMKGDSGRLRSLLSCMKTNIGSSFLTEFSDLLFCYGDYYFYEVTYTNHDTTLHKIKEADQ